MGRNPYRQAITSCYQQSFNSGEVIPYYDQPPIFINPQPKEKTYQYSYCLHSEKQGCGCGAKDWIEKSEK